MPRSVRHVRVPTDGYRQVTKEKILYADGGLAEGTGQPTFGTVGNSPTWSFATGADSDVIADLKLPRDRVVGTPIIVKIVYTTNGAGDIILWFMDVAVVGEGNLMNAAGGRMWVQAVAVPANIQQTSDSMQIQAVTVDGYTASVDLQLRIGRQGTHALDTSGNAALISKVIVEYTGYD